MGGRGGSSGFSNNGNNYDKNGFLKYNASPPNINTLQGSEKQIKYAQDIINKAFEHLDNMQKELRNPQRINPNLDKEKRKQLINYNNGMIQDIIDAKNFLVSSIEKYSRASQIIDRKDAFSRVGTLVSEFEKKRKSKK